VKIGGESCEQMNILLRLSRVCCCRNRYITFVKTAAYQFQQLRLKKMTEAEQTPEQVGFAVSLIQADSFWKERLDSFKDVRKFEFEFDDV